MPTTHRCSQEEYVLDLDILDWCVMSLRPTPEAEKTAKSPPTIPTNYKIPRKPTATSPTAPETPSKTGHNLLFLLHGLTPEPYRFRPGQTLLRTPT
uniref:Uncharacterized protein n=1 Tax=Romanomermis culicivorax TaxID=13658 RepID=A0A915KVJ1_ROMCU